MSDNKKKKIKLQIIFSAMILAVIFLIELYALMNLPDNFLVIGVVAVLFLGSLYVLMNGILALTEMEKAREEEQYDSVFKSEKASYLMLKKYFEEIEEKLDLLEKVAKVPTEEIVGTQKGIGKVVINRNRENTEALLRSNDLLMERMDELEKLIASNNDALVDQYKGIGEEQLQKIVMRQNDLVMEMKDMEIRLDNAILQSQHVIAASAAQVVPVAPEASQMPATPEAAVEPAAVVVEPLVDLEPEEISLDQVVSAPEPEVVAPDVAVEAEVDTEPAEISLDPVVSAPEPEVVAPDVATPEPAAPEIDLSDPNKKMSPDEIAALFASMSESPADVAVEPEVAPEPTEISLDPVVSAPEPEVVAPDVATPEPATPEIDLSDPNKKMSPDEIAALFASMSESPAEPVVEPAPDVATPEPATPEIDLSDPNKQLSPDEIAALFASMGS